MPVTASTIRHMRALVVDLEAVTDGHVRELSRAYVDAWDTVVDQLRDAIDDLLASGDPVNETRLLRSSKIASALQAIADSLDSLAAHTAVVITDGAGQVTSIAVTAQAAIAGSQLPAQFAGNLLKTVNSDVIDTIVARTAGQITARTRPLSHAGQVAVRRALVQGAAAADNPVKVAREMVRLARAGAVDLPLWRAEAISRTELLDAGRQASAAWEQANRTTLKDWTWLSSLSNTTCASCWSMHGRSFPLDEPGPHDHVNGRCTRMTRTKSWADLGIDLPEPDGVGIPDAQTAFGRLPKADQLQIMGPARLKALDDGAEWQSLSYTKPSVDWRPSQQVTPVRDLATAS